MTLDFPFLSSTKTYAALCPEQYGGSQSPAELGGLGQHPDSRVLSPFQPVQTRSIGHQSSSASNFATICGAKGEDRGKHPTLGMLHAFPACRVLAAPYLLARLPHLTHSVLHQPY